MRKKTIVHIHQKFYPYQGGSTHRLLNQLININTERYNIIVISQKLDNEKDEELYKGIKIIRYKKFYQIIRLLKDIEKKYKIDLLHSHNYRPSFYTAIFNVFHNKKMIIEMHSIYEVNSWLKKEIGRFLLKIANQIIVLSNESKRIIKEEYKIDKDIEIIYNGIELDKFINSDRELSSDNLDIKKFIDGSREKGKIIIGYIGSLREFQGIDNVIKIINSINNKKIRFIVIGGTEVESAEVAKKITSADVLVKPFVEKTQARKIYKNLDILLMPRPNTKATQSAIPLKPIEALASGNIIYSTNVGGMNELNDILKSNRIKFMTVDEMIIDINSLDYVPTFDEEGLDGLYFFDEKIQAEKLGNLYEKMLTATN